MLCLQILKFFTIWGRVILNKLNNNMKNNLSSIQKEEIMDVMFTNAKVLHHLGEMSHNLNKLNNNLKMS